MLNLLLFYCAIELVVIRRPAHFESWLNLDGCLVLLIPLSFVSKTAFAFSRELAFFSLVRRFVLRVDCHACGSTATPSFLISGLTSPIRDSSAAYSSPQLFSSVARIFLARAGLRPEVETATVNSPLRKKEGTIKSDRSISSDTLTKTPAFLASSAALRLIFLESVQTTAIIAFFRSPVR